MQIIGARLARIAAVAAVDARLASIAAASAALSGTLAAVGAYVGAGLLIGSGSTGRGWALVLLGNRLAVATVLVCIVLHAGLVLRGAAARRRAGVVGLLAGATAVPVAALLVIGGFLAADPTMPLGARATAAALQATGRELAILPLLLAVAAAALPVASRARPALA